MSAETILDIIMDLTLARNCNIILQITRNSDLSLEWKWERAEESRGIKRQVWLNNLMFLLAPEACIFILQEKKIWKNCLRIELKFFQFSCTIKIILKRFCLWEHLCYVNNMSKMFTRIFITRNEVYVIFFHKNLFLLPKNH